MSTATSPSLDIGEVTQPYYYMPIMCSFIINMKTLVLLCVISFFNT